MKCDFELLDKPVAFHKAFRKYTGSISSTLLLSQMLYWSKRTTDKEGWFYKTAEEFEEETGLTRKEQITARRDLRDIGWVEERLNGVPATLFFRLTDQFTNFIRLSFAERYNQDLPTKNSVCTDGLNLITPPVQTISENTTENTKKKLNKEKTDSEKVLCKWNRLAAMYGFKTCRVWPKPFDSKVRSLMKETGGRELYRTYWKNIEETMSQYAGMSFTKYFTLEYVLRDAKRPLLLDNAVDNFPKELDHRLLSKSILLVKGAIVIYTQLQSDAEKKGISPAGMRYSRQVARLRQTLSRMQASTPQTSGAQAGWEFVKDK